MRDPTTVPGPTTVPDPTTVLDRPPCSTRAAMHRLLADLRTFDAAGGWYRQGFGTCAHWLSWRVGWDLGTAREHLRVARALHTLPQVSEALAAGQISYSKTRAITRVATAATEAVLLGYAQHCTASQLETVCRKVGVLGADAASRATRPHDSERYVAHTTTASGMVCVKACLRPDEAALLLQVLQQAAVDCTREPAEASAETSDVSARAPAPAERTTGASAETRSLATTTARRPYNRADGLMALVQSYARGSRAERAPVELIVTVPVAVLQQSAATTDSAASTADSASHRPRNHRSRPLLHRSRRLAASRPHRRVRPCALSAGHSPPGLRLRPGRRHRRRSNIDRRSPALHRPQDPHYPRRPQAGTPATRSHLPLPRLRSPLVPRGPPPAALGRRRRDLPAQLGAALLAPPLVCPRARLSHHTVRHWRARLRRSAGPRRRPAAAAPRAAAARLARDPCRQRRQRRLAADCIHRPVPLARRARR
ncbi:MAG: DUF222 domain-containing protein [Myxococcales bacterium]|nr:DUF222 domain-containing protein [Myxococcales bacterium]